MISPKRPSGFNEFLPADQMAFNAMVSVIKMSYEQHGYAPIETPALELAEVLLAKEGGETAKQVYRFNKGDTDLALRFDLTIPLARYAAEHYNDLAFPFRRYQIQEVWRAEKSQAGRYRQFYQCDIDVVGSSDCLADVDVLITAHSALSDIGLKDVLLKISHRGLLSGFLETKKLGGYVTEVLRAIDKLDKQGEKSVNEELIKVGLKHSDIKDLFNLVKISGTAKDVLKELRALEINQIDFQKALEDLTKINDLLLTSGLKTKNFCFDLRIARGLDYYTGMVFETILEKQPNAGSICGGGRYDNLLGHYHKDKLPGVGASIGLSRLFSTIKEDIKDAPASPAHALVISLSANNYALQVAATLRKSGLNIFVYPANSKMDKQLKYANKLGVPFVILCGSQEETKETVTVKDMRSGKQETMKLNKAAAFIKKTL